MSFRRLLIPAVVALLLTGCASGTSPASGSPANDTGAAVADLEELTTTTTVIDDGSGARLCLGGVGDSNPPVCAGPVGVLGWHWADVADARTEAGTTWGDYSVVGTWDGRAVTLTETPTAPEHGSDADVERPAVGPTPHPDAVARAVEHYREESLSGAVVGFAANDDGVRVSVVLDDGSLQADADERFGTGVVAVESRLRPVD